MGINLALPWQIVATEIADVNFNIVTGKLNKPESLVIPSKPPLAEQTAEDQPIFLVHKHPDDPREQVDIFRIVFLSCLPVRRT